MERLSPEAIARIGAYGKEKRFNLEHLAERIQRERLAKIKQDNSRLVELAMEKEERHRRIMKDFDRGPTHSSVCKKHTKRTVSETDGLKTVTKSPKFASEVRKAVTGRKEAGLFRAIEQKSNIYEAELLRELRFEDLADSSDEETTVTGFSKGKNHKTMSEVITSPVVSEHSKGSPAKRTIPAARRLRGQEDHAMSFSHSPNPLLPSLGKVLSPLSLLTKKQPKSTIGPSVLPAKPAVFDPMGQSRRQELLEKSIEELNLRLERLKQMRLRRKNRAANQRHGSVPVVESTIRHARRLAV